MDNELEAAEMDRAYREYHETMERVPEFWCNDCKTGFDEPELKETWDAYDVHGSYAVSYFDIEICPSCYSENIEELMGFEDE